MSRPQAKYFLFYPSVLAMAALLLWIEPTNLVTGVSSAIGGVIACLMMWEFLFINRVIRLSTLGAMGLAAGYGAGTLNSWLTLTGGFYPLAYAAGQTVPEMANGVAAALMGCAILLSLGELLESPVVTLDQKLTVTRGVKYVIFVNFVIICAAAAAGKFHQGGIKAAGTHHAGVVEIFLDFLLSPTVILVTITTLVEREKAQQFLFGGMAVFLWLLEMTQGRRDLVFPALVTIALARFFGYEWNRLNWRRVGLVAIGIAFLFLGVLTYQLMRLAGGVASNRSFKAEGYQVAKWAQEGRAWKIASSSSVQNVKGRTLIVTFLGDLLYREQTASPALGQDLLLQLEIEIPSLIYKNKPTIAEENLASRTFGVFYPDESNSILTAGALDFGIWGVMVYPIATFLLLSFFLRFVRGQFSFEVFLFGLIVFLELCMAPENQLSGYFGAVRDVLIFAAFIYVISRLPVLQWKSEHQQAGW